jgi:hypothetical protein
MPSELGSPDATETRLVISPPSGEDALLVRERYLRSRRSRPHGAWTGGAPLVVAVGLAFSACVAGVTVFILGS